MDKIWAPWRREFVQLKKKKGCIFCQTFKSKNDKENYLIFKSKHSFVMMNIFPYNNGHLMVAPHRHIGEFDKLNDKEMLDCLRLVQKSCRILKKILRPQAFNIGLNIGKEAGAGYAGHLHFHIVPRWRGDTNCMPVISDAKIIPQSLNNLYGQLKKKFK